MKRLLTICLVIFLSISCKKDKEEVPPPYYDEFVLPGDYYCPDRWGTGMIVLKHDSSRLQLSMGQGRSITEHILRKYNYKAGYEFPASFKILRFQKTDKGYVIAGDTLEGLNFIKRW